MKHIRWPVILALALLAVACEPAQAPDEPEASAAASVSSTTPTTQWACRNDVEIQCDAERCEASESFTPMSVTMDDAGSMSVCAYSGCWEGRGTVARGDRFVVLTGQDLPFTTAPDSADAGAAILIALDLEDEVAILKAGSFAQPLRCQTQEGSP